MGVVVPGTGMVGLPIAAAIGAVAGDPQAGLQVLRDVRPHHLPAARGLADHVRVGIREAEDPLYCEVVAELGEDSCRVVIRHEHTRFVLKERNGACLYRDEAAPDGQAKSAMPAMTLAALVEFAANVPAADIGFMLEAAELNSALSEHGRTGDYGMRVGAVLHEQVQQGMLADDLLTGVRSPRSSLVKPGAPFGGSCRRTQIEAASGARFRSRRLFSLRACKAERVLTVGATPVLGRAEGKPCVSDSSVMARADPRRPLSA